MCVSKLNVHVSILYVILFDLSFYIWIPLSIDLFLCICNFITLLMVNKLYITLVTFSTITKYGKENALH